MKILLQTNPRQVLYSMKYPDDTTRPKTPFYGDQTGEIFTVPEKSTPFVEEHTERSFETQSGYVVLVKHLGSRLALSFKRQIGTPPTSSIFLTNDEAKRLANVLDFTSIGQKINLDTAVITGIDTDEPAQSLSRLRFLNNHPKTIFSMLTVLFITTVVLCAATGMYLYQMR